MGHHIHQSHYNPRVNDFVSTVSIYVHIPVNLLSLKKNHKGAFIASHRCVYAQRLSGLSSHCHSSPAS